MHLTRAEFDTFVFLEPRSVSTLDTVSAQVNIIKFNFICKITRYTTELESIKKKKKKGTGLYHALSLI